MEKGSQRRGLRKVEMGKGGKGAKDGERKSRATKDRMGIERSK